MLSIFVEMFVRVGTKGNLILSLKKMLFHNFNQSRNADSKLNIEHTE